MLRDFPCTEKYEKAMSDEHALYSLNNWDRNFYENLEASTTDNITKKTYRQNTQEQVSNAITRKTVYPSPRAGINSCCRVFKFI